MSGCDKCPRWKSSRCYSAALLQEVLGQLQSLKLAGVLFQTLTQSKRFVWEAVLTRRKKHSPFNYLIFSSFYASSRVLPNNCSSWFSLRAQRSLSLGWWAEVHQMAGAVPAGAADSEQSCCLGSGGYGELSVGVISSVLRPYMKRLRYSLCRDFWVNDSTILFCCPLFWGDASWNCHCTQDQFISWDVSSRQVLTCPKLGS